MSAHYFIAPSSVPTARWAQAFPGAHFVTDSQAPTTLKAGDVVWLSDQLPDWQGLVRRLYQASPEIPVVVLSMVPDESLVRLALELGARGICHALAVPSVLQEVAAVVSHGGLWVGAELVQRMLAALDGRLGRGGPIDEQVLSGLTDRERAVARRVAAGDSNREIAEKLSITERTVKAHLSSIFNKLGIRDRVQLMLHCRSKSAPAQPAQV